MSPKPATMSADQSAVMKEPSPEFISRALQTVQEGLKYMQSLQSQTAETHKLFLQSQTEAGNTLQIMMDHTRRFAEASHGTGSGFSHPEPAMRPSQVPEALSLSIKREINIDRYPILQSHILNGQPVVPFALIIEWLGHCALHENPGLLLCGLDDIRLLKGILLDGRKKTICLMTEKTRKNGPHFEMNVEIRDEFKDGKELIHTRARAVLSNELSVAPEFDVSRYQSHAYARSIEEVYDKILFHGNALKGLQRIISLRPRAMVAELASAPPPDHWTTEPMRSHWIADPLVLDAAFQMASVWCFEQKGMVSLPSFCAGYRQYCSRFPEEGVIAVLEIRQAAQNKMLGDFTFLDGNHAVIARLTGYEAVMDTSLIKAFKN